MFKNTIKFSKIIFILVILFSIFTEIFSPNAKAENDYSVDILPQYKDSANQPPEDIPEDDNIKKGAKKTWKAIKTESGEDLPDEALAGMVGNIYVESAGFKSNATEDVNSGKDPYGAGGYGLIQWTAERRVKLFEYAEKKGEDVDDFTFQVKYIMKELKDSYPEVYDQLKKVKTVDDATIVFMQSYERPAESHTLNHYSKRLGASKYAMEEMKGTKGGEKSEDKEKDEDKENDKESENTGNDKAEKDPNKTIANHLGNTDGKKVDEKDGRLGLQSESDVQRLDYLTGLSEMMENKANKFLSIAIAIGGILIICMMSVGVLLLTLFNIEDYKISEYIMGRDYIDRFRDNIHKRYIFIFSLYLILSIIVILIMNNLHLKLIINLLNK